MASVTRAAMVVAAVVVMVVAAIGGAKGRSSSSSCATEVSNLNVCAPFVVPGNNTLPSTECCAALGEVDHDCLCNALNIADRLPSQCHLPSFTCS